MKFGGPKEVSGAIDLISSYKLVAHHDFYCKRSIPLSLSDAHYLENIVGDTDIRKGDGMQLDELVPPCVKDTNSPIQPFALDILRDAFQLRESARVDLSPDEKGVPTRTSADKEKEKPRDKKDKKEKRSRKDKDKEMKNRHGSLNPTGLLNGDYFQKRKTQGNEGLNGQKKSKHKT